MKRDASFSNDAGLARLIREAIRLGSAAAIAIAVPGCGGKVVVDVGGAGGGGGSGGASSVGATVGSTSSTGAGPFSCDVPIPPGNELTYACIPAQNGCPPAGSQAAINELGMVLNMWTTCPEDPDFCACGMQVSDAPCGPDPGAQGCCYYAELEPTKVCEGRPFVVEGRARTAAITEREGWCATVRPDAGALDAATRAALAEAWAGDAQNEHASVASFARFVLELLALGAPADLVRAAQQAIADEIRHAELCFGIASALAGSARGPASLPVQGALAGRGDAAAIAAAVVREGCIGETLSALGALAARDAATDPAVRAALDEIADDEAAHAALAWRTAAWMWASGDAAVCEAMDRAFAEAGPPEAASGGEEIDPETARAFGRLSADEQRAVAARGLAEVVRPSAAALRGGPRRQERAATPGHPMTHG